MLLFALPGYFADEERSHLLDVQRGLLGLAHPLNDGRERIELWPQQADHEVVVILVQSVASEADVVAQPRLAEGAANAAMLQQDDALLVRRQPFEGAGPPQG